MKWQRNQNIWKSCQNVVCDKLIGEKHHLNETMILSPLNLNVKQSELFLTDVRLGCWKGLTSVRVDEVLQKLHISKEMERLWLQLFCKWRESLSKWKESLSQWIESFRPVVQDQVFVPAYRTRAPSADSALSAQNQTFDKILQPAWYDYLMQVSLVWGANCLLWFLLYFTHKGSSP